MKPENFCYWLQGFVEISNTKTLSENEWLIVKDHLNLVFNKQTPYHLDPSEIPKTKYNLLNPLTNLDKVTC